MMTFEIWRNDKSSAIIAVGDASTRAFEMQEPNSQLVRRIEVASVEELKDRVDLEMHTSRLDDLNIPAKEFQITAYPCGICVGDVYEVVQSYSIELPDGAGRVPSNKPGSRYRVVEGDVQDPDLVVMQCTTDDVGQFHSIRANSSEWKFLRRVTQNNG